MQSKIAKTVAATLAVLALAACSATDNSDIGDNQTMPPASEDYALDMGIMPAPVDQSDMNENAMPPADMSDTMVEDVTPIPPEMSEADMMPSGLSEEMTVEE
jgi:hypothetical protein